MQLCKCCRVSSVHIRPALSSDAPAILSLIHALALYEKQPEAVEVCVETLAADLSAESPPFECVLALDGAEAVAFALFFQTYSTWRGRSGMWLEDLFVLPERRGKGIGKSLLSHLAALAVTRGYARFEWSVLDWNEPAIRFYESVGAKAMEEWTTHRVDGHALITLAGGR